MVSEAQPVKRQAVVSVIKDAPAQLNLGSLNDPLPMPTLVSTSRCSRRVGVRSMAARSE